MKFIDMSALKILFNTAVILLVMQSYGGELPVDASIYFYIGYFSTPLMISGLIASIIYVVMRRPPKQVRKLNNYFKDQ